jgi:hypothetical protein
MGHCGSFCKEKSARIQHEQPSLEHAQTFVSTSGIGSAGCFEKKAIDIPLFCSTYSIRLKEEKYVSF